MNEKEVQKNEEMELDLQRIFEAVLQKAWVIGIVSGLCALLMLMGTLFFVTPLYKSTAMFYVNNNDISVGDVSISNGDLVTSRGLVESYIVILNTRETLNDVIDYAGINRSYSQVKGMISAAAVNETEIFAVTVTGPDPAEAEKIANAIAYILPKRISTIIDGTSAKVVDAAVVPTSPSSPSYTKNTIVGFLVGFLLSAGIVVLMELFDITVRSEEDITQICKHPILATVPDMGAPSKGGKYYYYKSGSAESQKKKKAFYAPEKTPAKVPTFIGADISFSASEAYKLLRTKLQFSFADDRQCRVIGLSSALSGEGKSLTAVNLAYTLSQLNKRVILIDCDMRRPTLAEKMNLRKKPGLSSYLTGQRNLADLVQVFTVENGTSFHVIAAGQNPPNPIELLSSARMTKVVNQLRESYDYVILDLPPVGEVSDAMAVADKVDGILLVVRQNYCDRISLGNAARQFDFIQAKILGVVFNCTSEHGHGYGKKYYKKNYRYYRRYNRYYSHYENSGRSVSAISEQAPAAQDQSKV